MTTLPRYSGVEDILRRLDTVRARHWALRMVTGALAVGAILMAVLIVVAASLGYWSDQPPRVLRWAMLFAGLGAVLAAAGWFIGRNLFWKQNPAQTARFIEEAIPELQNDLINSVLLSRDGRQVSPELVQCAIHEAVRRAKRVDLNASISTRPLARWVLAAGLVGVLLAGFAVLQPGPFKRGLMGAIVPTAYVQRANRIELVGIEPADGATCFAGETIHIVARVRNPLGTPHEAEVIFNGMGAPRAMFPAATYTTFALPMKSVEQSFEFAVKIGDSRWPADKPYFKVNVLKRVKIEGLDLQYDYPAYTALKPKVVRNADGAIEAPMGTRVMVTLRVATPVRGVMLDLQGAQRLAMRPSQDRMNFSTEMQVHDDGAYRVVIEDTRQQLPDPEAEAKDSFSPSAQSLLKGYYRIHAEPDAPPKIEFLTPNRDTTVPPRGKLDTKIRLFDKYGLTTAAFYAGKEGQEPKAIQFFNVNGKAKADVDYAYEVPEGFVESDVIVYYATVTDNRNLPKIGGPQTSTSSRFKITVQDAAKAAEERAKRYDELRKRLMDILHMQEIQRVNTGICLKQHGKLEQVKATGGEIAVAQKAIKAALLDLADKFPFDKEMVTVQQAVAILANNEAQLAIDQSQLLVQIAKFEDRSKPCELLGGTQDKIIDTLQTLLAIMPSLANKADPTKKETAGADLPPDALDKLANLKEKLEQFLEDQKKVIQATERLAKKPVDAFTAEDDEILKALISTEDKWEKFMNEAFADFSKLVEQDFSNPAMLKELMSVKSDVTMAKDALKKKATEIATAAEDSAMGGGEEIKDNIEKWLPDEPDRIKWAMEAPENNAGNIELPELPKELEDLVGDLLEQEEELFDDMDDVNSKAAGSGSEGIGWDAMDGPISNMGAQGVTGNQLPNTNELSGRSGEGRQGKSSGEFVEDKAVGKGGRRTPTRLTPEPFQKGQVDDQSTEPPGGATGGGKLSGAGAEGLEGPLPPEIQKEMPRLAEKQAALVNKAERLRGQFKVNDYANFKFLQAITLMNRVRSDLENYRYQNALRAKDGALAALKQTKLRIGNIDVTEDTTSGMPKYIRDDISDAMKGKLPEEFKDVLEQYFRRLSEQSKR